jgi:hypothetical protein
MRSIGTSTIKTTPVRKLVPHIAAHSPHVTFHIFPFTRMI